MQPISRVVWRAWKNKALEDYLRTVGATWFQGYYYSKPVGADELEILLSAKK